MDSLVSKAEKFNRQKQAQASQASKLKQALAYESGSDAGKKVGEQEGEVADLKAKLQKLEQQEAAGRQARLEQVADLEDKVCALGLYIEWKREHWLVKQEQVADKMCALGLYIEQIRARWLVRQEPVADLGDKVTLVVFLGLYQQSMAGWCRRGRGRSWRGRRKTWIPRCAS